MRVGFLALQAPDISPGQRYRVEAFLPWLEQRGVTFRYDWLLDRHDLRTFYGRGGTVAKAGVAAKGAWRRLKSVVAAADVDLYFVQREAFFLGGPWSEQLAGMRAPVVYDFDDAVWIRTMSEANRAYAWLKNVDKMARIAALAQTVIAGNSYLAEWARRHSGNVHVVPTCVDTDRFSPPATRPATGPVTIGWSGSPTTIAHLRPLMPALERVVATCGSRVRIRVMGDPSFSHLPLGLQGEAWSPEAEQALLRETQIGVMPLPDDPWTRGKCGFKGLLSMAVGAATVMSPVGVNSEIVLHGQNGLLATTEDEWVQTLVTLVNEGDTRARIADAGRQTVVDRYSVHRWESTLAELLHSAAASR